jgi:UDP-N-acetyl-2-amino-2-deoxyglucuronate dehydrogenase
MKAERARTYGFGIIGCGTIAPVFADAIAQLDNARLVAVSDVVAERACALATKHGADWHSEYGQLLRRDDIDIACVLTWSGMHADIGITAALAGKHVITTKPIDVTLPKIDRLIGACREHSVKLAAIHQMRSFPSFVRVKRAIDEGRFGRIHFGNAFIPWCRTQEYYDSAEWRGTWQWDGGGCLMNQGIHCVDLLQWLAGPVVEVQAYTDTLGHRIEVEDAAVAALRFEGGALGLIMGSTAVHKGLPSRIEVFGATGNVVIEGEDIIRWQVGGEEEIGDFLRAIEEDRPPFVSGEEARKSVAIVLAIYESTRTGRPAKPG